MQSSSVNSCGVRKLVSVMGGLTQCVYNFAISYYNANGRLPGAWHCGDHITNGEYTYRSIQYKRQCIDDGLARASAFILAHENEMAEKEALRKKRNTNDVARFTNLFAERGWFLWISDSGDIKCKWASSFVDMPDYNFDTYIWKKHHLLISHDGIEYIFEIMIAAGAFAK